MPTAARVDARHVSNTTQHACTRNADVQGLLLLLLLLLQKTASHLNGLAAEVKLFQDGRLQVIVRLYCCMLACELVSARRGAQPGPGILYTEFLRWWKGGSRGRG